MEKEERMRDLKTIGHYRHENKRDGILNMLNSAITTEHVINPSLGYTEFFEFVLRNPYNVETTVIIECQDPELRYVKSSEEKYTFYIFSSANHFFQRLMIFLSF